MPTSWYNSEKKSVSWPPGGQHQYKEACRKWATPGLKWLSYGIENVVQDKLSTEQKDILMMETSDESDSANEESGNSEDPF